MTDRIPSDHDSVETVRATVERVGRTDRRKVTVPEDAADLLPDGEVVQVVLAGETAHATVERDFDGQPELTGAFDSPTLARSPGDGEDRLGAWLEETDLAAGESVLLDVVTEGFMYGLREPGERTVYEATEPPSDSLSAIARDVQE